MVQDRAEIRVQLDARQAQAQARRARAEMRRREQQAARVQRERSTAAQQVGAIAAGTRGGITGAAAAATGVAAARAARTGVGGAARAGAARVAGPAAVVFGAIEAGLFAGQVGAEALIEPIVRSLIERLLPDIPGREAIIQVVEDRVRDGVEEAIDEIRAAARFDALTSQLARRQVIGVASKFARAGDAFTADEVLGLSDNAVEKARRDAFLARQESARNTKGASQAVIDAIRRAFGE